MDATRTKRARLARRKRHVRKKMRGTAARPRVSIYRSLRHIYCQAIDDARGATLASASSLSPDVREEIGRASGNRQGAEIVGRLLASRLKERGITAIRLDRNGRKYHGRLAALTEALRKEGIEV